MERTDDVIAIEGIAESYARITELMRRLDSSDWFREADLSDITAVGQSEDPTTDSFRFSLTLSLELLNQRDEEV